METRLEALITEVQARERSRRRMVYALSASTIACYLLVTVLLSMWHPLWASMMWAVLLVPLTVFLLRGTYETLAVSREFASALIDTRIVLKGRVTTFTSLAHSSAAPDLLCRSFLAQQIEKTLPSFPSAQDLIPLTRTRHQRIGSGFSGLCLALCALLFLTRPLSVHEQIAQKIEAIVVQHPEIPQGVQDTISDLATQIAQGESDLSALSASLENAQEEVALAIAKDSLTKGREISAPHEQKTRAKESNAPIPTPTPKAPSSSEQKGQNSPSEETQKDQSNEKTSEKGPGKSEENNETSPNKSSQSEKESQSSESKKKSDEKSGSQGESGQESSKDSQEEESGSGQGSGNGSGSGSSGSGSQQSESSQQQQGQGSGDGKAKGQGAGASENSEGSQDQSSGKSGAKSGAPQPSSDGSQGGLEKLQQALNEAQEELKKEESSSQQKDGKQQSGQGGKGEGTQSKQEAQQKGAQAGSQGSGAQPGSQPLPGRNSQQASEKKDGKGDSPSGKQGSSQQEKPSPGKKEPNGQGAGQSGKPEDGQTKEKGEEESTSEGEREGVGEHSSMPDRNAPARTEDGGGDRESGSSDGGKPKGFKEAQITDQNEAFDAHYTGSESSLEKNSKEAAPKTSLEDVLLAKPKGSLQKGEQPIPLEYKGILSER